MKTLILGTCCLDLVINVDQLPELGRDVNAKGLSLSLGGMAYNVYQAITVCKQEAILGCPAGEGIFSELIMKLYEEKGVSPFVRLPDEDNGLCLCLVSEVGERSFLSYHGAEYRFKKEWYAEVDFADVDLLYFSGLEVEEESGSELISFVEEKKKRCFFAPSSRVVGIDKQLLERIYALHPLLHVNEFEAFYLSGLEDVEKAAEFLFEKTNELVVVTLGDKGCYFKSQDDEGYVAAVPLDKELIVDTIGAGDGHAGALIAALKRGYNLRDALAFANRQAAGVLKHRGAGLVEEI